LHRRRERGFTAGVRSSAIVATPDPPSTGIANPIHDADGAAAAGYAGALVAGVRTYGWAAETVMQVFGLDWVRHGWADFSLRRPLHAGEEVSVTVSEDGAIAVAARGRVVLDGRVGIGDAAWLGALDPPDPAPAAEPPSVRPSYVVETAPVGEVLRPLGVYVSAAAARRLVTDDLGLASSPVVDEADPPLLHPFFLAARMAPLTRHNFTYGPTIHVRTQIQHLRGASADQEVTIGARLVAAFERNGHGYQVLDGVITGQGGSELGRLRHHTIFHPRGTVMARSGT
jgi:acyl dehydratase